VDDDSGRTTAMTARCCDLDGPKGWIHQLEQSRCRPVRGDGMLSAGEAAGEGPLSEGRCAARCSVDPAVERDERSRPKAVTNLVVGQPRAQRLRSRQQAEL
jgi:hypothetical protein